MCSYRYTRSNSRVGGFLILDGISTMVTTVTTVTVWFPLPSGPWRYTRLLFMVTVTTLDRTLTSYSFGKEDVDGLMRRRSLLPGQEGPPSRYHVDKVTTGTLGHRLTDINNDLNLWKVDNKVIYPKRLGKSERRGNPCGYCPNKSEKYHTVYSISETNKKK